LRNLFIHKFIYFSILNPGIETSILATNLSKLLTSLVRLQYTARTIQLWLLLITCRHWP